VIRLVCHRLGREWREVDHFGLGAFQGQVIDSVIAHDKSICMHKIWQKTLVSIAQKTLSILIRLFFLHITKNVSNLIYQHK